MLGLRASRGGGICAVLKSTLRAEKGGTCARSVSQVWRGAVRVADESKIKLPTGDALPYFNLVVTPKPVAPRTKTGTHNWADAKGKKVARLARGSVGATRRLRKG